MSAGDSCDGLSPPNTTMFGQNTKFSGHVYVVARCFDVVIWHTTNVYDDCELASYLNESIDNLRNWSSDQFLVRFGQFSPNRHLTVSDTRQELL